MNDTELLTMMKHSFAGIRADTPLEQIERRGRAVRRRRRGLTGAATAAAAVTTLALILAAQTASPKPPAQRLAAWTVTKEPDGIVEIIVRQLSDPAGLQRELRAYGVAAFVRFD